MESIGIGMEWHECNISIKSCGKVLKVFVVKKNLWFSFHTPEMGLLKFQEIFSKKKNII